MHSNIIIIKKFQFVSVSIDFLSNELCEISQFFMFMYLKRKQRIVTRISLDTDIYFSFISYFIFSYILYFIS